MASYPQEGQGLAIKEKLFSFMDCNPDTTNDNDEPLSQHEKQIINFIEQWKTIRLDQVHKNYKRFFNKDFNNIACKTINLYGIVNEVGNVNGRNPSSYELW